MLVHYLNELHCNKIEIALIEQFQAGFVLFSLIPV